MMIVTGDCENYEVGKIYEDNLWVNLPHQKYEGITRFYVIRRATKEEYLTYIENEGCKNILEESFRGNYYEISVD